MTLETASPQSCQSRRSAYREREFLFPERIENYVSEDNPVRFIEGFADKLVFVECGFIQERATHAGRPSYSPRDLLKLSLNGYFNRTRSSRMLERAYHVNLEVIWFMRRLKPDYRTIAEC